MQLSLILILSQFNKSGMDMWTCQTYRQARTFLRMEEGSADV